MAQENLALELEAENKIRQILIQKIKDKAAELGRVPRQSDFTCQQRFYAVFGSWNEALKAAGFPIAKGSRRLKYRYLQGQGYEPSREECIASLRKLSDKLGCCRPTSRDIESKLGIETGCPKVAVFKRLFGSLDNALTKAGLSHLPTRRYKEEEERRAAIDNVLNGKPFLLSTELKGRRDRRYAKERNVPIVHAPKDQCMLIVLDWMRGVRREGVLPSIDDIRSIMGEQAFQFLCDYCRGLSLEEIGRRVGLSREGVRQILNKKASKLAKEIIGIPTGTKMSISQKEPG